MAALPPVAGDAAMIQRVWLQLLGNAVKFTESRPDALIEVGAIARPHETIFFVRDNGVGFDMRFVGKLFGVFNRLHGSEFPGNGVGLAIVRRIVTRHGGRVWAEGWPGKGAAFHFSIPKPETGHA